MITVEQLKEKYNSPWEVSYWVLVEMGCRGEIVADGDIGDYRGDYLYLVKKGDQYTYIVVGYGSCSGCDTLQGCGDLKEVAELGNDLTEGAVWRSKDEMVGFLNTHDAAGSWYGDTKDWQDFKEGALKVLGAE